MSRLAALGGAAALATLAGCTLQAQPLYGYVGPLPDAGVDDGSAGEGDGGKSDSGHDASEADAEPSDAGEPDAEPPDAGHD